LNSFTAINANNPTSNADKGNAVSLQASSDRICFAKTHYYGMIASMLFLAGVTFVSSIVACACHRRAKFLRNKQTESFPSQVFSPATRQLPLVSETSGTFGGIKSQFLRLKYVGNYGMDRKVEQASDGRQTFLVLQPELIQQR